MKSQIESHQGTVFKFTELKETAKGQCRRRERSQQCVLGLCEVRTTAMSGRGSRD